MPDRPFFHAESAPIRPARRFLRQLCGLLLGVWCAVGVRRELRAEEDEPPPPAKKDGVSITFLPPPIEGTISLGIYDAAGKLVRVLHREAAPTEKNFFIGLNGLVTKWDGRDDAGQPLSAGKYHARGWMLGDQKIAGVAFHGNDWIVEDGPRYQRVLGLKAVGRDEVQILLKDVEGKEHAISRALPVAGAAEPKAAGEAVIADGKLSLKNGETVTAIPLAEGEKAIAASVGFGGDVWAIVEMTAGREVRAYLPNGEFLRRLAYAAGEPAPQQIAASPWGETIYLFEQSDREQRFRVLTLGEAKERASAWKTVEQKRIVPTDSFVAVTGALGRPEPLKAEETLKLNSKPNSLLQNARTEAALQVVVDAEGALLKTADGLPLAHLSDTKGLKWAALVREGKAVLLFQGDGAVVEEFKLGRPEQFMAFDAGEYTLKK
jgi:hypothetical protein